MKSYLQGMITGVVLVFATMVLVGASVNDIEVGRYQISTIFSGAYPQHTIIDTQNGEIIAKIRDHNKNYKKIDEWKNY